MRSKLIEPDCRYSTASGFPCFAFVVLAIPMVIFTSLILIACGKSSDISSPNRVTVGSELQAFSVEMISAQSGVELAERSYAIGVEKSASDGQVVIAVNVIEGKSLEPDLNARVLYPRGWKPISFHVGEAWGGEEKTVSLAVMDLEGFVPVAVSYVNPYRELRPTQGSLFTMTFAQGRRETRKAVSIPPSDSTNHISRNEITVDTSDLVNGNLTFVWKEKNKGDYNRDGTVSISDVTPVAEFWGYRSDDNPAVMEVVDGDGNGLISISDITPIAENFFSRIQGYRVWRLGMAPEGYLPNVDNPSDSEVSASRPDFETAPPGRLTYTYTDTPPNQDENTFYRLYAYADGEVGARSDDIYPFRPVGEDVTPPDWQGPAGIQSASPGNGKVQISWTPAIDADSPPVTYLLFWNESSQAINWDSPQQEVAEGTTSYLVEGLTNDVEYVFGVRARDSANPANSTTNTNTLTATPSAGAPDTIPPVWQGPDGIQTAIAGDGQVTISWTSAVDEDSPPVTYSIYYAPSATGIDWGSPQDTAPEGTTNRVITGLTNGTEYVFAVRARDNASPNPNSTTNTNFLTATPEATQPSPYPFGTPPTGMSVIPGWKCTDTAVAVDSEEDPVIVSTNSKGGTGLNLHYYDDDTATWLSFPIVETGAFYHPAVKLIVRDGIGAIYVAAFDEGSGAVMLYVGDANGQSWNSFELISGYAEAFSLDMDNIASYALGIVVSLNRVGERGANDEVWFIEKFFEEFGFEKVLIDDSQEDAICSFSYLPSVEPVVILGRGTLDFESGISDAKLAYAKRESYETWTVHDLPGNIQVEGIDTAVDPVTRDVFVAFTHRIEVLLEPPPPYEPQVVPAYQAGVGMLKENLWTFETPQEWSWFLEGDVIHLLWAGADPQVAFTPLGTALFTWVQIDAAAPIEDEFSVQFFTNLQASYYPFSQTPGEMWAPGYDLTEPSSGASADSLAFSTNHTQVSFTKIPVLDYFSAPRTRNDFPEGDLAFYKE